MRNKFENEMHELNELVLSMGKFIDEAISKAMEALKNNDKVLAKEVYENDYKADELESKIEKKSLRILLTEQPVAKDLRTISTALKMITDMERICDQCADIAEIITSFENEKAEKLEILFEMAEKCVIMVTKAIDSFISFDLNLANAVIESDDQVDNLFLQVRQTLIEKIEHKSEDTILYIDYLMIAKYLERIGDHAQNIAEWVVFNITGEHKNKRIL